VNGARAPPPQPVIDKLHAEIVRGLNSPSVRERLKNFAAEGVGNTPGEFAALIRAETVKWAKVIKDGNVKVD
jgi:tripartite-type tricarboxylate transporter receptor subunit TctC